MQIITSSEFLQSWVHLKIIILNTKRMHGMVQSYECILLVHCIDVHSV